MSSASRPTPDAKHHRIAVVGAGCAGSSLAVEFAARGIDADVTLFDPAEPAADRTWCFWETTPHRFADAITKRWPRVTVRGGGTESTIDVGDTPYACVRASDFHRLAAEAIDASGCTVRRGVSVEAIRETDTGVELDLASHGATLGTEKFDFVFDGRPQRKLDAANESEPTLLQHFGGIELAVPAGTLDTSVATLMDFDVPQHDGAHFMYALPFASDRVLVESTFLTPKVGRGIDYEANAMTYAREVLGIAEPRVVYRESGVLPMTLASLGPRPTARVWPIGTRAGVSRASSGYAFDAIQRDTKAVVDAFVSGKPRPRVPRSCVLSMLDRVLISWLASDQTAAPRVFGRLFERAPACSLVRFLADMPRPLDYLAVMWAMPKLGVIGHTMTHPASWPRRSA